MADAFTTAAAATETKAREPWYVEDKATLATASPAPGKRQDAILAILTNTKLTPAQQADAIGKLPPDSKEPFRLHMERGVGKRSDLVMVQGEFRCKRLSPAILRAVAENAAFVLEYVKTHTTGSDE